MSSLTLQIDVLQTGPWLGAPLRQAIPAPFVVHSLFDAPDREAVIGGCAPQVRALICHSGGPLTTRQLLDRLPKLELILNLGAGTESVDLEATTERNIPVLNSVGFNAVDVAELAFGLVLSLGRDMIGGDRHVRASQWPKGRSAVVHRVSGKRMGILGMGAIGKQIARRAEAFDMTVSYFSRRPADGVNYPFVPDLLELARCSDYLVSALPGGAATHHLVNAVVLAALGPQGYLINVGRGTVVDEHALIEALEHNRLAGAGLDVFENEPNVPQALLDSPRTVLQAHRGGATFEAQTAIINETVKRLHRHFVTGASAS